MSTQASSVTSNYGLSQWAEDDLVSRTDFNADNTVVDDALTALSGDLAAHAAKTSNPHAVTCDQVGAATSEDLSAHTADTENPHAVSYSQTGAAAANHTHDADCVTYDNSASGFAATDVQAALDEAAGVMGNYKQIVFGTYTGTGNGTQTISLDFTPSVVYVQKTPYETNDDGYLTWGLALAGSPQYCVNSSFEAIAICTDGFTVLYQSAVYCYLNYINKTYNYVAFK